MTTKLTVLQGGKGETNACVDCRYYRLADKHKGSDQHAFSICAAIGSYATVYRQTYGIHACRIFKEKEPTAVAAPVFEQIVNPEVGLIRRFWRWLRKVLW